MPGNFIELPDFSMTFPEVDILIRNHKIAVNLPCAKFPEKMTQYFKLHSIFVVILYSTVQYFVVLYTSLLVYFMFPFFIAFLCAV